MPTKKQRLAQLQGNWTASEISIVYKVGVKSDLSITYIDDAYPIILSLWNKELINLQEQAMAFFFNGRNKMVGYRVICTFERLDRIIV